MELNQLTELYLRRKEEREGNLLRFYQGEKKYLIVQRPAYHLWGRCNSIEEIYQNNLKHLESWLTMPWSDELPHLQAWIGTGVFANAFGCEYLWREDNAPDTRVRYQKIEQVKGLDYPDWRNSPIMGLVLEGIDVLKERTRGRFPIALTDTQSPFDTATLILDTTEFLVACHKSEDTVFEFMDTISDLIIVFSRVQRERIGEGLVSKPGHVMPSLPSLRGITLSDDNLAVSSPQINENVSLRFNQKIAEALDGVAIHSCGVWDHTMKRLKGYDVIGIDCSLHRAWDPDPNTPEGVREALKGSGIAVKARCGGNIDELMPVLEKLVTPELRLILDIARLEEDDENYLAIAESNYRLAAEKLAALYGE